MKKIHWCLPKEDIMFEVNRFEFFILKRIFKKKKYKIFKPNLCCGEKVSCVIMDEVKK